MAALLADLALRQLLVVTGKGGVGKTTVAAALAFALADAGRRTLLLEVDPRENAHRMLGAPPSGGEIVTVRSRLQLQNLRPRAVLDQLVREQVRIGPVVRRILSSEVYRHFAEGAPGFKELAILGHALRLVGGLEPATKSPRSRRGRDAGSPTPAVDVVVLDAPATGHGLSLLLAPRLTAATVGQGPFGRMAGEVAALVDDPARTAVVIAAAAEEIPMHEALESLARLRAELGREAQAVVVNGLFPAFPAGEPADDPAGRLWRDRRHVQDRELARLAAAWQGARVDLPLLALDSGPPLVAALAGRLAGEEAAA